MKNDRGQGIHRLYRLRPQLSPVITSRCHQRRHKLQLRLMNRLELSLTLLLKEHLKQN